MSRDVGFLVFPGFQLLDLSGPLAAFEVAASVLKEPSYKLRVLSLDGGAIASSSGLSVSTEAWTDDMFDTLVVPGGSPCVSDAIGEVALRAGKAAPRCRRIASICTGAFVLARAGLLDGKRATTHWRHATTLQQNFPRIRVDAEPLFVQDGQTWTATGTNAGIDMALAMIEQDYGAALARTAAQLMVVHQRRPGGQAQFAGLADLEPNTPRIRKALNYARTHLHERLSVEDLAGIACLGPRQFSRVFTSELGMAPARVVERLRAEAARLRIETSSDPIELIARKVGFEDPERMRRAFLRVFGQPPQSIRRALRAA